MVVGDPGDMQESLPIKEPLLIVGIGGAGSRLAVDASKEIGCKCVLISNDRKDLVNENHILVNSGQWLNPSTYKLRAFASAKESNIRSALEGFNTIIVISNLAGKAGAAMAPVVCKIAKENATVIAVSTMPFGFEKDRIFASGVALKRVQELSHAVVVMDNDSFLENNPELTKEECFAITNKAIIEVLLSIHSSSIGPETSLLCTSKQSGESEDSLRDSMAMLHRQIADTGAIKRAMVYVMGGEKLPLRQLDSIVNYAQGIFKEEGTTEVAMTSMISSNGIRTHLIASATQKTRFDSYDPLAVIPKENYLDWDDQESTPDIQLAMPILE